MRLLLNVAYDSHSYKDYIYNACSELDEILKGVFNKATMPEISFTLKDVSN